MRNKGGFKNVVVLCLLVILCPINVEAASRKRSNSSSFEWIGILFILGGAAYIIIKQKIEDDAAREKYLNSYNFCQVCHSEQKAKELVEKTDWPEKFVCKTCDLKYDLCDDCNQIFSKNDLKKSGCWTRCNSCHEKNAFITCKKCGSRTLKTSLKFFFPRDM